MIKKIKKLILITFLMTGITLTKSLIHEQSYLATLVCMAIMIPFYHELIKLELEEKLKEVCEKCCFQNLPPR